jgi:hypothetical protein
MGLLQTTVIAQSQIPTEPKDRYILGTYHFRDLLQHFEVAQPSIHAPNLTGDPIRFGA